MKSALLCVVTAMAAGLMPWSLAWAQNGTPSHPLDLTVEQTPLTRLAKNLLLQALNEAGVADSRLADVVLLKTRAVIWEKYARHWWEVGNYLRRFNLRLGLTPPELEHYRQHGQLPDLSVYSLIEALPLSPRHLRALDQAGANTLQDVLKLRRRRTGEPFVAGLGKPGTIEVVLAMAQVGFPLDGESRKADEARPPNWIGYGDLSYSTLKALSASGIDLVENLLAMTELELEQIDGLGPKGIIEIGHFFSERGQKLYDSVLDRTIAERQSLDLALRIHPAARLSPLLKHHLDFYGIETFNDFLDQQKLTRIRAKPLPRSQSRELKSFTEKFHQALESTLQNHARLCGMYLQ